MQNNYYDSKEFTEALDKYEKAMESDEPIYLDCDQLADIAEYYHWMGYPAKALAAADYALSLFEGATAPLVLKARMALLNENNPEKAEQIAEQIADKTDLEYFYIKAEILVATNQGEQADLFLENSMKQLDELDSLDFVLDAAILFIDYEYVELAKKWLKKSNETDQEDYREVEGRIKYYEGEYEDSEHIFNSLIDKNPYSAYYWDLLASSQLASGKLADTITSCEYAIAINPNDEDALLYKGQALMQLKNDEAAIEYFDRLSQVRTSNVDGYLNTAYCLFHLERYEEGFAALRKAETRAKRHYPDRLPEIYQEAAFTYSQIGQKERALAYLDKMEQMVNADPYELLVSRAHILCENGDIRAQSYYQRALEESRYQPSIMLRVAVSLYDNGILQVAYNILCTLSPSDMDKLPQAYAYRALCAHDLGLKEEYIKHLKDAVEKDAASAKSLLSTLFPEDMEPKEYVEYASENPL